MEALLRECELYGVEAASCLEGCGPKSLEEAKEWKLRCLLYRKKLEHSEVSRRLKEEQVMELQSELNQVKGTLNEREEELNDLNEMLKGLQEEIQKNEGSSGGGSEVILIDDGDAAVDGGGHGEIKPRDNDTSDRAAVNNSNDNTVTSGQCREDAAEYADVTNDGADRNRKQAYVQEWLTRTQASNDSMTRELSSAVSPKKEVSIGSGMASDSGSVVFLEEIKDGKGTTEEETPAQRTRCENGKDAADGRFICSECSKVLKTKLSLKNHKLRFHTNGAALIYKCDKCPKSYIKKRDLEKHQSVRHDRVLLKCQFCQKEFYSQWLHKEHEELHHGGLPEAVRLPCSFCSKTYSSTISLNFHIRKHHPTENVQ